jgi:hypothetical protein
LKESEKSIENSLKEIELIMNQTKNENNVLKNGSEHD